MTACTNPEVRALVASIPHNVRNMLLSLRGQYGTRVHSDLATEQAIVWLLTGAIRPCGQCAHCRHVKRNADYRKRKRAGVKLTAEQARKRRLAGYKKWRQTEKEAL